MNEMPTVDAGDELPPLDWTSCEIDYLDWSSCEIDYDERVDDVRLGGY